VSSEPPPITIRTATIADAAACLAIYRPLVESTAVSFEEVVPTSEEFAARIENALSAWTWLSHRRMGAASDMRTAIHIDSALRTGGQSR